MRFRHTTRSVRWTPAPVATAAVLALAALGATPTPARSQAFVCTPAAVLCEVVDNRSVNIAGRTISTLAEPSPLAFELRGPRARIVNRGTAELEGNGWFVGVNTSFGSPDTPWPLINGNDERPDDPATLRLRSPGDLRIGTGLRNIAGRIEVVEGRAWVAGFSFEAGEVSIAAGSRFTSSGDMYYRGDRQFLNDGVLDIDGRLFNTGARGNLDLGAGQTILRGPQVSTLGRVSSTGNVRFDRVGGEGIEVQADLDLRGDTVVDIRQPSFPGFDELWLNGSFAARTATFHNLNILSGVLRVGVGQRVEVTGDLVIGDRIRLDTLANGGIVMRARPGDASEARLIFGNATPWTSGLELLTVDRPVVVSGLLPRGVRNRSVIGLQGSGGPDPFNYRISLGAFDNLGRLEVSNDARLDIDNDAGGTRLEGVLAVADRGTLRINADRPGGFRYEIATLENWNPGTGTLSGARFEINGVTLTLAGSATTLRNESRLELTSNARIATDAGDIRAYDNRRMLTFVGGREQIVSLDNSTVNSEVNFVGLFNAFVEIQTLRNVGVLRMSGDANGQLRVYDLVSEGAPGQPHTLGWRDGRLAGGVYQVFYGSMLIQGGFGPVQTLASSVTLVGSTARLGEWGVSGSALDSLALIERGGWLQLFNGASFQAQSGSEFVNEGRLTVGPGSSFVTGPSLRQSSGVLNVDGTLDGNITWVGGILEGTGRINGNLFVSGGISGGPPTFIPFQASARGGAAVEAAGPGPALDPIQGVTIGGTFQLADTAVVEVVVPANLGAMPVLALGAEGGITLDGTLRVDFSGAGVFLGATQLTFLQLAGNVTGQFANVTVIGGNGKVEGVSYALVFDDATGITTGFLDIAPVPEPGTWALMLLGAAGIAARVRRVRPASPSGV